MSDDRQLPAANEESASAVAAAFASLDGVTIPPVIKRGVLHAINRLLGGLVDIPAAHLEGVVQRIKTEANAKSAFALSVAQAAAEKYNSNPALVDRAVEHYGARLLREQHNRENVVQQAVEDIRLDPPTQDATTSVDDDWLEAFSRVAETKSNKDLQLILSRILSGEIRQPGSYKQRTLHVLSTLDQDTGRLFQRLCDISFQPILGYRSACVIVEPFGRPGSNDLSPVGLDFTAFTQFQDAGLVQAELNGWREYTPQLFTLPFSLGNKTVQLKAGPDVKRNPQRTNVVFFTAVGIELRRVLTLNSNPVYNEKFVDWAKKKFGLEE